MSARVVFLQSSHAAHHPRHHFRFAAALADAGYDVLTMAQPDLTDGHRDAVPVRYLPRRRNRLMRMLTGPLTVVRALRMRPDVLAVVSLDLLPWAFLARALRRDLTVVYDSNEEYDLYVEIKDWLPRRLRRPVARLVRGLEPWLGARLDAVTVAVPATHAKFRAAGARTILVRNLPPSALADSPPRGDEFAYEVLVGGSLPPPQLPILADTVVALEQRLARPARWVVAARHFGDQDAAVLHALLEERDVLGNVTLLRDRPFDELRELAAASALGFAPYPGDPHYRVALPIRLFEYMAWGVPFVTSRLPAFEALLDGADVGAFVPAGDTDGYAEALADLLTDQNVARELGENGRQVVGSRLNWEREADALLGLYGELATGPVR
jgi:glycosyltransferase involved in cell wall biosynthesis